MMNRKGSLYAVIGGVVGAVLTMAAGHVMPIGAQNGDATFGEITCTKLNVVDVAGETKVSLGTREDGGYVDVKGKTGSVRLGIDKDGGNIMVWGDKDGRVVVLGGGAGGMCGYTSMKMGGVRLNIDEDGGYVGVKGKAGKVGIGSDERGGSIVVQKGNGLGAPRVLIGVDSLGGGRVITWDKNGE